MLLSYARAGAAALVGAIGVAATSLGCADPAPPVRQEITVYRPIGTWSGRGTVQTEAFIGQTGAFRVTWRTRTLVGEPRAMFRVVLHSSVSGRPLLVVVERDRSDQGETHVTEDPREFFLVIEAGGVEWTVTLDEAVRALGPAPGTL